MYRIDIFQNNKHEINIFQTERQAREYANNHKTGHVFLLKEIGAGIFEKPMFEIVEEITSNESEGK